MKTNKISRIMPIICYILFVLLLTSCGAAGIAATTPSAFSASPTEDLHGLSPEAAATLRSLEKLSDYPFYVMRYSGGYDYPRIGSFPPSSADISCSLFAALGSAGDMVYGRNFDWGFSPTLLLFTDPPDGYASASMVDLEFLGIDPAVSRTLSDLPLAERETLLAAPALPFDGMNEYGLTIAMAALPNEFVDDASFDASRPTLGSIGIIRQVLDHARNVDEAVSMFGRYNIDLSGGPPIHYLLADPGGKSVLIEFYQSEMQVLANDTPWHLATNHLRWTAKGDGGCQRYRILSDRLSALDGQLDPVSAMDLLSQVKQGSTQWSSVYNMTSGDINVVVGQLYDNVLSFHLELLHP